MPTNSLEFQVLEFKSRPIYDCQGLLSVTDDQAEYLFSVNIIAESEEAATRFFEAIQSEQSSYIGWYIGEMHQDIDLSDSDQQIDAIEITSISGIISATIRHLSEDEINEQLDQRVTSHGVNSKKKYSFDFSAREGYVKFTHLEGAISVSWSPSEPTGRMSAIFKDTVIINGITNPPRKVGPFSGPVKLIVINGRKMESKYDITQTSQ